MNDTSDLGRDDLRWRDLYLASKVDDLSDLEFVHGGVTEMTLATDGNLTVDGTVTADAFVGDGSGLTDINAPVADDSATSAKIVDGQVMTQDIANHAVTTPKLADGAVTNSKIADGAVNVSKTSFIKAAATITIDLPSISDDAVGCGTGSLPALPPQTACW